MRSAALWAQRNLSASLCTDVWGASNILHLQTAGSNLLRVSVRIAGAVFPGRVLEGLVLLPPRDGRTGITQAGVVHGQPCSGRQALHGEVAAAHAASLVKLCSQRFHCSPDFSLWTWGRGLVKLGVQLELGLGLGSGLSPGPGLSRVMGQGHSQHMVTGSAKVRVQPGMKGQCRIGARPGTGAQSRVQCISVSVSESEGLL